MWSDAADGCLQRKPSHTTDILQIVSNGPVNIT